MPLSHVSKNRLWQYWICVLTWTIATFLPCVKKQRTVKADISLSCMHFLSLCQSISKFLIFPSSHYLSFSFSSVSFCVFTSINLFRGSSIIHLPSREVFPEGKLLWRPAWPRTASDWPSACLPFCILHCLFNKEQSECDFQGRVPVIVALTPCLSNDPHYGASDSSLKGLIYEYAGTVGPQASTHQLLSMVYPHFVSTHRLYIRVRGRSRTHHAYTCNKK